VKIVDIASVDRKEGEPTGEQQLLPMIMQSKAIVEANIRFINCWAGIATNESFETSGFCQACEHFNRCERLYHAFSGIENSHPLFLSKWLCQLFNIKSEYMRAQADLDTYYQVLSRDIGNDGSVRCIRCGERADDVHEIMPKSWFGKAKDMECFAIENRCCLCRDCHNSVVSDIGRGELLYILSERYGYNYTDSHRRWLIEKYKSSKEKDYEK